MFTHSSWTCWTSLWSLLELLSGRLMISSSLGFFVRFYLILSFETYSSVTPFCIILCYYFYVLDMLVMFLGEMGLWWKFPVGPGSTLLLWPPELYAPGMPLCGLHGSSYCEEANYSGCAGRWVPVPWGSWMMGLEVLRDGADLVFMELSFYTSMQQGPGTSAD